MFYECLVVDDFCVVDDFGVVCGDFCFGVGVELWCGDGVVLFGVFGFGYFDDDGDLECFC